MIHNSSIQLGLQKNWQQFSWLVLMNSFVGGMIGLERSIFPAFAEQSFGITSHSAILSFIIAFGFSKAIANLFTGQLANRFGRKKLLVLGWLIVLPAPFLLLYATSWSYVVIANVLLGVSQGITWSSTVLMKIDLVGEKQRGLAMGLNEFAGYLAVGATAFIAGYLAHHFGVVPYPFYVAIAIAFIGLFFSIFIIRDTRKFVHYEIEQSKTSVPILKNKFLETSFQHPILGSVTIAGMVNNLNDGMIWGILPILLMGKGCSQDHIGVVAAVYPAVWGLGQLITGYWSDKYSKKNLMVIGMILQGAVILIFPYMNSINGFILLAVFLGWGTAMVYPTFLSTIATNTHPSQRAAIMGIFRFWRDSGYSLGALLSGIIADQFGIEYAFLFIGGLTLLTGVYIQIRIKQKLTHSLKFTQ